jgi:hypothetical protein
MGERAEIRAALISMSLFFIAGIFFGKEPAPESPRRRHTIRAYKKFVRSFPKKVKTLVVVDQIRPRQLRKCCCLSAGKAVSMTTEDSRLIVPALLRQIAKGQSPQ